jgi:hypothetical protein
MKESKRKAKVVATPTSRDEDDGAHEKDEAERGRGSESGRDVAGPTQVCAAGCESVEHGSHMAVAVTLVCIGRPAVHEARIERQRNKRPCGGLAQ